MPIPTDFITSLEALHPRVVLDALLSKTNPKGGDIWALRNEIRPVDLYCYFIARFGPPNGFQNFLRKDDSDNLIHWDWTLSCKYGWLVFLGMNFRTEIQLVGQFPFTEGDKHDLIVQIKADFANYNPGMSEIRKKLENWVEFVNPYQRLRRATGKLLEELRELNLSPANEKIQDYSTLGNLNEIKGRWKDTGGRYSKGLGLCFGVRSMLPVMAEAFINLALFVLMRPEIKADVRLKGNAVRQPIDIRIKSLHLNCVGFEKPVDYSHEACRAYHSLVSERNDLLHGNVVIEKLRFNDVFFHGRVPIFNEYRSMWERSLGVEIRAVGLQGLSKEVQVVDGLIEYVLSCMHPSVRAQIERIAHTRDLGFNESTGRIGILFPDHLTDMHLALSVPDNE